MAANRLEQLVADWEPRLHRAFLEAVYALRDAAQINLIAEMLERGDVDGALRAAHLDPISLRPLDVAFAAAFEDGGRYTADRIPDLRQPDGYRLRIEYDARNPRAEAVLRDRSFTWSREMLPDMVAASRQHLVAGMERGDNPRTVALDLAGRINPATGRREGGVIGLAASQEGWVRSFADRLRALDPAALGMNLRDKRFDRTIAKAIREEKELDRATLDKMVRAYRNSALRWRAVAIGRTEAMAALHEAQNEAMRQAIDKGVVQESAVTKIWRSAGDHRVRDTHRVMNGQKVQFRAEFVSPSGARLRFPGDPRAPASETAMCRCTAEYRIDFLAGVT